MVFRRRATPPGMTVAKLSKDGFLIGVDKKEHPSENDVVVPSNFDLPFDGTYKWDFKTKTFAPKGSGGTVRLKDCSIHHLLVLYQLTKLMSDVGPDIKSWQKWYEKTWLQHHTERKRLF